MKLNLIDIGIFQIYIELLFHKIIYYLNPYYLKRQ